MTPAPKPRKLKPKARQRNSTLPRASKPMARKAMKRRARPVKETVRIYGPKERRAWITSLPCCVRGCKSRGRSQQAHTVTGGMSRKADASAIVPMCAAHHKAYDEYLGVFAVTDVRGAIKELAYDYERRWQLRAGTRR